MSPVMEDKAALKHILVLAPFDLGILKLGWKIEQPMCAYI